MSENNNPNTNPIDSTSERKVTQVESILQQISKEVNYLQILENTFIHITKDSPNFSPSQFNNQKMKAAFLAFQEAGETLSLDDKKKYINSINQQLNLWRKQIVELEKPISVENLRRFIEKSNPPVHHQILISLARFYFVFKDSNDKRCKFETLAMSLFSDDVENQKRKLLHEQSEIAKTYQELFLDWTKKTKIEVDPENVNNIIKELNTFIDEAKKCQSLDDILEKDVLGSYQTFKQNLAKSYFHREIFAEIVVKNINLGNIIIDKISNEIGEKKDDFFFQTYLDFENQYSLVVSKTFHVTNVLPPQEKKEIVINKNLAIKTKAKKTNKKIHNEKRKVNKFLIAACILSILITLAFNIEHILSLFDKKQTASVEVLNQNALPNGKYLAEAKLKDKTLQIIVKDDWSNLTLEDKKTTAIDILAQGPESGYTHVVFVNSTGEEIAKAGDTKVEILK